MRFYTLVIYPLLILVLVGCANQPKPTPVPVAPLTQNTPVENTWAQQQQQMFSVENWMVQGKLAVKQGRQGHSAQLSWAQYSPHAYEIELVGPLGQGTVLLSGNGDYATLKDARGTTDSSHSAESLLYKHTGWSLPIASLYYWARGLPDPNYEGQYVLNAQQQLHLLKQHGWHVVYDEYQQYGAYTMPRRITLEHPDARATLLLRTWQINLAQ